MKNPPQPDSGDFLHVRHEKKVSQPFLRMNFATLWVRDQERSRRFFVDQLGFHTFVDVPVGGGRWIVVAPPAGIPGLALVVPPQGSAESKRIGQNTGLSFLTENVRAVFEKWSERGVRFTLPPMEPSWGSGQARYALFEDVDGNGFSLLEFDEATRALETERQERTAKLEAERLLAREFEIAKDVQAGLLPREAPSLQTLECAGACVPARHVGGDYYDFLELPPGRAGLVLADIAGKGISGALLMSNLQANLRVQYATLAALKEYFPLALDDFRDLLRSVNRLFHKNVGEGRYATLFLGNYDDRTRRLSYVNCGHPAPVLMRGKDQRTVERLESTSTVIGLFDDIECHVAERQLATDDVLIIYSDGITEAVNADGQEFGEDRLLASAREHHLLPTSLLAEKLVEAVRQFSYPEQADDITLVVARCVA